MKLGRKLLVLALLSLLTGSVRANDLAVRHVTLREGVTGKHGKVEFDLRWDNSWRNDLSGAGKEAPFNYDAAWIFVKFSTDSGATWRLHLPMKRSYASALENMPTRHSVRESA